MKLSDILTVETIKVPLAATDKRSAIEELVEVLLQAGKISEKSGLLEAVLRREAVCSTGIGQGLAVPHAKCDGVDGLVVAAGKPAAPMEFQSLDGRPVSFIMLMGSRANQTGPHIQALARISRFMMKDSFRARIERARTPRDVYQVFLEHEE